MPVWTKISGVWRRSHRLHTKVSGTWKEEDKAHVKISGTWRRTHRRFYFPANCIIPYYYDSGAATSFTGWARYSSSPTAWYMPIGVNSWSLGATASSGNITVTTTTSANHLGNFYQNWWPNYVVMYYLSYGHGAYAGGHNHSYTFNPNSMIARHGLPFLYATSNQYTMPIRGIMLSYGQNIANNGGNVTQVNSGADYFLTSNGPSSWVRIATAWSNSVAAYTTFAADHVHGSAYAYGGNGSVQNCHRAQGYHNHSFNINRNGWMPAYRSMSMWGNWGAASYGGYGSIVMYPSATAPEGWSICDGTNGTPDMRDRFAYMVCTASGLGGGSGGSWYLNFSGTTGSEGGHTHNNIPGYTCTAASPSYHYDTQGADVHTVTDTRWWAPALWGIYYIMFTG